MQMGAEAKADMAPRMAFVRDVMGQVQIRVTTSQVAESSIPIRNLVSPLNPIRTWRIGDDIPVV